MVVVWIQVVISCRCKCLKLRLRERHVIPSMQLSRISSSSNSIMPIFIKTTKWEVSTRTDSPITTTTLTEPIISRKYLVLKLLRNAKSLDPIKSSWQWVHSRSKNLTGKLKKKSRMRSTRFPVCSSTKPNRLKVQTIRTFNHLLAFIKIRTITSWLLVKIYHLSIWVVETRNLSVPSWIKPPNSSWTSLMTSQSPNYSVTPNKTRPLSSFQTNLKSKAPNRYHYNKDVNFQTTTKTQTQT